jgi:hypothetical protein
MSNALLKKYKESPNALTPEQKDKLIMEYAPSDQVYRSKDRDAPAIKH